MSNQGINPVDTFASSPLNAGTGPNPFLRNCPHCHSEQVVATIIAPISEEIVFRGWLLNALKRKMQVWPALILSSIAFSAIHPSLSSITTFFFGVCVAVAYYKTQNLWVGIIIHSLNNFLISAQSIIEHVLIHRGLVGEAFDLNQSALVLEVPSLLMTVLLGYYLVQKRHFFNLTVPLYP